MRIPSVSITIPGDRGDQRRLAIDLKERGDQAHATARRIEAAMPNNAKRQRLLADAMIDLAKAIERQK